MVKKQALVVLLAGLSLLGSAFGLGLGDIDVKSNLNDPLEAEIELIQLQGLSGGEILPTLASNDDFRRAGVERSFFLANIQFRVKETESGEYVVTLTTRQAVREPFLNFLVEVNWPGGRLLKEYTVLLDPPVFDTGLAVDALTVDSGNNGIQATDLFTTTVVEPGSQTTTVALPTEFAERDDVLPAGKYRVQRDDTLWEIALKVPGRDGYSPQQVMLAIQDLNPEAFLNGNINRVKAGSVLTLPDGRQISMRSLAEAVAEVNAQNKGAAPKLRAPVGDASEVQLSATESTSSALPTADGQKNPDGYLELTADSESSTTTASGESSAVIDQLQNQLSVAEELNDQFERERDELESRVEELQEQISIMERLLDVQNSDLAQVQQALVESQSLDEVDPVSEFDTTPSVDPVATTVDPVTPVEPVTPVQPAVATPAVQQPVQQPAAPMSLVDQVIGWVTGSITNMAITGLGLLMIILLPLYIRSKRSGGDQTLGEMNAEEESYEAAEDFSTDFDDDLLAEVEEDFEEEASAEPDTIDAVVEAEMYMAYQKYDQAEEKLKEAFADHPDRSDIGMKLLEVYAETGDSNAFNELNSRLSLDAEQQAAATELKAKLPIGGGEGDDFESGLMVDDLSIDLGTDEASGDLDFDLDLDAPTDATSNSSDLDFDMPTLDAEEPVAEPEAPAEDLDFSLDLGDLDATEEGEGDTDLDFSLEGLDESISLDAEEEPVVELDSSADLDFSLELEADDALDLDLSGDLALTDEVTLEEEAPELSADIDLSIEDDGEELSLDVSDDLSLDMDEDLSLDIPELEPELPELSAELDSLESPDIDISSDIDSLDGDFGTTEIDMGDSASPLEELANSLDSDAELEEDEFDFLSGNDEASTKLDLARAYIEMDDKDGAKDILEEVVAEGNDEQKAQATELMSQL